jgi:putative FmdB family regulatory protein
MPIYEYQCNQCEQAFEMVRRFSEADLSPTCPQCESANTQRKLSKVAAFGAGDAGAVSASSCTPRGGFS